MDTGSSILSGGLVLLLVLILVFLVLREAVCWYWKINKSLALLTEIRDLLASKNVANTEKKPI
jgi:hypothetical protein